MLHYMRIVQREIPETETWLTKIGIHLSMGNLKSAPSLQYSTSNLNVEGPSKPARRDKADTNYTMA